MSETKWMKRCERNQRNVSECGRVSFSALIHAVHSLPPLIHSTYCSVLILKGTVSGWMVGRESEEWNGRWRALTSLTYPPCVHYAHFLLTIIRERNLNPVLADECEGRYEWNKGRRTQGKVSERPWTNRNTWEPRVEYQPRSFSLCSHVGSFYSTSTPTVGFTSSYLN